MSIHTRQRMKGKRERPTLAARLDCALVGLIPALFQLARKHPLDEEAQLTQRQSPGRVRDGRDAQIGGLVEVAGRKGRAREDEGDPQPGQGKGDEEERDGEEQGASEGALRALPDRKVELWIVHEAVGADCQQSMRSSG